MRVARRPAGEGVPDFNIFGALANAPQILKGYSDLGGRLLFRGALDPKARELVINAIAVKLNAPYEWSHHVGMARGVGVTDDELRSLRDGTLSALTPEERACVAFAAKVDDRSVTSADVDNLRAAGLDDERIVELTALAGFYGMTARFLLALDVEIDEGNPDFGTP